MAVPGLWIRRDGETGMENVDTSGGDSGVLSNGDDRTDADFAYVSIMGTDGELKC